MVYTDIKMKNELLLELVNNRVWYIQGEITNETAKDIGVAITLMNTRSETEPITIYIDSPGGFIGAGLDVYDRIAASKAPTIGVVYRQADSMAAVVLQACKIRRMHRHSQIVLHYSSPGGTISLIDWEKNPDEALAEARQNQEEIFKIFSERLGRPVDEIKPLFGNDSSGVKYTAEAAKAAGLIDEII